MTHNTQTALPARIQNYIALTRLDKPIGIYLLLWPTLWSLWLAADGWPSVDLIIIFTLGTVLMRSAGCVINDFADRNFDGHVKRTQQRPMATGKVSPQEALILFGVLIACSFALVLQTNTLTICLSLAGAALAVIYPFMKRVTHLPQVVLGAAFAWGIPMAWAAESNSVAAESWLIYAAFLLWTVAYDTQYAMVDRDDDLKIGIRSTAILFGEQDNFAIKVLQFLTLCILLVSGWLTDSGFPYYLGLLYMAGSFLYQQSLTHGREREACLKAFLSNHWAGLAVLAGIIIDRCFL